MEFELQFMICSHCFNEVTQAVKSTAPDAKVKVDLPNHKVSVETQADRETVVAALSEVGSSAKRLHSALSYRSLNEFESNLVQQAA